MQHEHARCPDGGPVTGLWLAALLAISLLAQLTNLIFWPRPSLPRARDWAPPEAGDIA
jgi:hypothetical protein